MDNQEIIDRFPGIAEWIEQCNIQQVERVGIDAEHRRLSQEETNYSEWAHYELTGNYTVTLVLTGHIIRMKKFTHAELFGEVKA